MEDTEKKIESLAKRLSSLQESLRLTDRQFAARYKKHLGSAKAWSMFKSGKWSNGYMQAEKVLKRLQGLIVMLEAASAFDPDDFFVTPFARRMNAEYERLMGSGYDRRCLVCLAPEGVGKSWWTSSIVTANPESCIYLRLSHTWYNRSFQILLALAEKLGLEPEKNPANQFKAVVAALMARPEIVLFIDEGHNGGVAIMKLLKDLIDETSIRVVYMAFPQQFDQVRTSNTGAIAEARQFLRRCLRPVFDDYRKGIGARDVAAYLRHCGFADDAELKAVARQFAPVIASNYNLSGLADAVSEAREEAEDQEIPLTLSMVTKSIQSLCSNSDQRTLAIQEEAA